MNYHAIYFNNYYYTSYYYTHHVYSLFHSFLVYNFIAGRHFFQPFQHQRFPCFCSRSYQPILSSSYLPLCLLPHGFRISSNHTNCLLYILSSLIYLFFQVMIQSSVFLHFLHSFLLPVNPTHYLFFQTHFLLHHHRFSLFQLFFFILMYSSIYPFTHSSIHHMIIT